MANKRLVLKEGFHVDGTEITPCHFCRIKVVDMWGQESIEFLVMIDDNIKIVEAYENEVFSELSNASDKLKFNKDKHADFCRERVEYYQKQLEKE